MPFKFPRSVHMRIRALARESRTAREIATMLNISTNTVRKHAAGGLNIRRVLKYDLGSVIRAAYPDYEPRYLDVIARRVKSSQL